MDLMGWSNGVLGSEIMASTPLLQYTSGSGKEFVLKPVAV
jgi:hypothetical protein